MAPAPKGNLLLFIHLVASFHVASVSSAHRSFRSWFLRRKRYHSNAPLARDLLLDGYDMPFHDGAVTEAAEGERGSAVLPGECAVSLPVCNLFGPVLRSFQARVRFLPWPSLVSLPFFFSFFLP
jgi:hypothetical protein